MIPSRSPSPANEINDGDQIDDDINIEELVENMNEDKIKAETEKY